MAVMYLQFIIVGGMVHSSSKSSPVGFWVILYPDKSGTLNATGEEVGEREGRTKIADATLKSGKEMDISLSVLNTRPLPPWETPRPAAHLPNLTHMLRTHCFIACKIDTVAYL